MSKEQCNGGRSLFADGKRGHSPLRTCTIADVEQGRLRPSLHKLEWRNPVAKSMMTEVRGNGKMSMHAAQRRVHPW